MNATAKAVTPIQILIQTIEKEAKKRFSDAVVERVLVEDQYDDGDILKVFIVLTDPEAIDPRKVASFVSDLHSILESELHEERFPVVSYFSHGEAAEFFPETN